MEGTLRHAEFRKDKEADTKRVMTGDRAVGWRKLLFATGSTF